MNTDLSVCQPLFDRDPVRYLDMTEAVRRGIGTVVYASPSAALVDIPSPGEPNGSHTYLMCCSDCPPAAASWPLPTRKSASRSYRTALA